MRSYRELLECFLSHNRYSINKTEVSRLFLLLRLPTNNVLDTLDRINGQSYDWAASTGRDYKVMNSSQARIWLSSIQKQLIWEAIIIYSFFHWTSKCWGFWKLERRGWVTNAILQGVLVGSVFEGTYIKKFLQNEKTVEAVAPKVVGTCCQSPEI